MRMSTAECVISTMETATRTTSFCLTSKFDSRPLLDSHHHFSTHSIISTTAFQFLDSILDKMAFAWEEVETKMAECVSAVERNVVVVENWSVENRPSVVRAKKLGETMAKLEEECKQVKLLREKCSAKETALVAKETALMAEKVEVEKLKNDLLQDYRNISAEREKLEKRNTERKAKAKAKLEKVAADLTAEADRKVEAAEKAADERVLAAERTADDRVRLAEQAAGERVRAAEQAANGVKEAADSIWAAERAADERV